MKKLYTLILIAFIYSSAFSQNNFQRDYEMFLEKQKMPLLYANSEVFVLGGTAWTRTYGEQEYVLTPAMQDNSEYNVRIRQLDNETTGIFKSKFHFINVEVTELSKSLLKNRNINIPDYIQGNVNVYLPEIDIDVLSQNNITFSYIIDYGNKTGALDNPPVPQAQIWYEDCESGTFPNLTTGGPYYAQIGITNCGWGDVNCAGGYYTGSWGLYCADIGAGCYASNCYYARNDMLARFQKTTYIPTSTYMNLIFNFWLKFDFYGSASGGDELSKWYWTGTSWSLNPIAYNNGHTNDGAGWNQYQTSFVGTFPSFDFQFDFYSNGSFESVGAWLDDLQLSGTVNGIEEINSISNLQIYPNPSKGIFSLSADTKNFKIKISNIVGEEIYSSEMNSFYKTIDLSNQSNGIYFLRINSENGTATKKIIINK